MKRYLPYEELKVICTRLAKELKAKHGEDLNLVAVARGGLTAGHIIAYQLAMPLHIYSPKTGELSWMGYTPRKTGSTLVFIEDLIAEGRTYQKVKAMCESWGIKFDFVPIVLDTKAPQIVQESVNTYGMRTSDWIVFPHEDVDAVTEGDRGLFREGTSNNSKPLV